MELVYDSKVGRGAFADVWLAMDPLGRSVAVKFFSDTNPSQAERNALEHAKALARVRHPAVVQVLSLERQPHPDLGTECLCIIMEFANGPNLSLYKPALDVQHARAILVDVAVAMDAIHAAGLVHGDLHDGNIVVTSTGAKVIDILYTHSLAEVGTKTASRTREDDHRALAVLFRQVLLKGGCSGPALEEAYFRAMTSVSSAASVQEPFITLLDGMTNLPSGPAAISHASKPPDAASSGAHSTVSNAPTQPDIQAQIVAVLANTQSRRVPLASCITEALALAVALEDDDLRAFCENELIGYDGYVAAASMPTSIQQLRKLGNAEHRAVLFYLSLGVDIDIDYFGSGQKAIEWMRSHPEKFRAITFLYPKPIGEIERGANATAKALLSVRGAAQDMLPSVTDPNLQVFCYAPGDALSDLLERIRTTFTTKLLPHVGRQHPSKNRTA